MLCKPEILRMMKEDQDIKEREGFDVYGGRTQEQVAGNAKTRKSLSPILRRNTVQLDESHVPSFGNPRAGPSEEEIREKR